MANKRITDVDIIESLNSNESFFVNQNSSIKQIKKENIIFGINNGGTGATTAAKARENLGVTPANIGAKVSGSVEPISTGGTGATTAAKARENLGAVTMNSESVILTIDGWSDFQQTVSISDATTDNIVIVSPDATTVNYDTYTKFGVRCISQANGTLTFLCNKTPDTIIAVNVVIFS